MTYLEEHDQYAEQLNDTGPFLWYLQDFSDFPNISKLEIFDHESMEDNFKDNCTFQQQVVSSFLCSIL